MRDLSLRSTSVHIVSSDSSFSLLSNARIWWASEIGSLPRAIVPEIGHVSTLHLESAVGSTRTYISGEAPTSHSAWPRLMRNP